MDGIIIINKEKKWTSNDVVQKIKGMFLIIYIFLNLINIIIGWKCGADQLKIKPGVLNTGKEEKRRR